MNTCIHIDVRVFVMYVCHMYRHTSMFNSRTVQLVRGKKGTAPSAGKLLRAQKKGNAGKWYIVVFAPLADGRGDGTLHPAVICCCSENGETPQPKPSHRNSSYYMSTDTQLAAHTHTHPTHTPIPHVVHIAHVAYAVRHHQRAGHSASKRGHVCSSRPREGDLSSSIQKFDAFLWGLWDVYVQYDESSLVDRV